MAARPEMADLFTALSILSWDEFQIFATHLGKGVDLPILKRIEHDNHTTDTRILHSIQAWMDYDFEVSWNKIIYALRKIGKNADAERLRAHYCPQITYHDSVSACSSEPPSSPVANPSPVASRNPSDSTNECERAATQAAELSEKFMNVLSKAKIQLMRRESESMFLKSFYTYLTTLPMSSKHEHLKFLKEEKPALKAAKDVDEIFDVIEPYLTYTDYSLLKEIITKFCSEDLQKIMNSYILELEEFEKTTTVHDVQSTLLGRKVPVGFTPVVIHTQLPPTKFTLYTIRQIKNKSAAEAALEPYSHLQINVHASAVTIVLAFPEQAVSLVARAMTPEFLTAHNIESVSVSERPLHSYIEEVSIYKQNISQLRYAL